MRKRLFGITVMLTLLLAAPCHPGAPIQVSATVPDLGSLVREIGGGQCR